MVGIPFALNEGPGVPDWLTGWGTVATAAIALWAMLVTIFFSVKSGRDARRASEALADIAKAQSHRVADDSKILARHVIVEFGDSNGVPGLDVRNTNSAFAVHDIEVDFVDNEEMILINDYGRKQDKAPMKIAQFAGESIADTNDDLHGVVQNASQGALVDQIKSIRVRFRDGRNLWWERVGNGEPEPIKR